jgi:RNA polymerase sigma-70 factor (ECF subfamily)
VFLRIFRNLDQFRPESGTFINWITRITRNLIIDHYRQNKEVRFCTTASAWKEGDKQDILDSIPCDRPSPHAAIEHKEKKVVLWKALRQLSPHLRQAVILRDLKELSYQEIAAIMKVTDGTIKSRINRGRAALARCLDGTQVSSSRSYA